MTYLTQPFLTFVFGVAPVWLPLLVLDLLIIALLLFAERPTPRTFIFWVAIVVVIPFGGAVLYLLLGCNLWSRPLFARKSRDDQRFLEGPDGPSEAAGQADRLRNLGADICTPGNRVDLFWDRSDMIPAMVADIESAVKSVYIMARRMPRRLDGVYEAMQAKARQGVDVRIMTSALGFGRTRGVHALRKAGAKFATFHNPLRSLLSARPAYRNMRSMVIVDGRVAFQGRGAVVRAEGPAADRLQRRFMADWLHATGEEMEAAAAPAAAGFPDGVPVQSVSAGPDHPGSSPILSAYSDIISRSRRTLYMAFPYLTPYDEVYASVKLAAASGVDVRILLPRRGKHWYQSWNSLAASNPLMMAGAKVYFADRMLGKCVMASDGEVCCIGSGDFTSRALDYDFNTCSVVYSEETARRVEEELLREISEGAECHPEEYSRRSLGDILKIGVARMMMFFN